MDKQSAPKLRTYIKAIDLLRKDPYIEYNYGHALGTIKAMINNSKNMRRL